MNIRQNLLLGATLFSLPFLTGCLAVPMSGTVEAQPTYITQPTVYQVEPVVQYEAPVVSMPAPTFAVPPATVHLHSVAAPAPKVKMKFGGLFGGGPKVSVKAPGAPKMTMNAKGMAPKMKVTTISGGAKKVEKVRVTKSGKVTKKKSKKK